MRNGACHVRTVCYIVLRTGIADIYQSLCAVASRRCLVWCALSVGLRIGSSIEVHSQLIALPITVGSVSGVSSHVALSRGYSRWCLPCGIRSPSAPRSSCSFLLLLINAVRHLHCHRMRCPSPAHLHLALSVRCRALCAVSGTVPVGFDHPREMSPLGAAAFWFVHFACLCFVFRILPACCVVLHVLTQQYRPVVVVCTSVPVWWCSLPLSSWHLRLEDAAWVTRPSPASTSNLCFLACDDTAVYALRRHCRANQAGGGRQRSALVVSRVCGVRGTSGVHGWSSMPHSSEFS